MLWNTLVMALREILRNTMRSILTMLGVVIGVAAVIAMVTVGAGATASITNQISSLGDNLLILSPGSSKRGPSSVPGDPLVEADATAISQEIPGVEHIAPSASKGLVAVYGNVNWRTTATGTTPAFMQIRKYEITLGRPLEQSDDGQSSCVLGATTRDELFGQADPLGQTLRLGKASCQVVGVLKSKGSSAMGSDQDDMILMPLKTFQRRLAGNRDVSAIYITVADDRSTSAVTQQVEALMRERRKVIPGTDDDFRIRDMAEIVDTVSQTSAMLTGLLGAIAAVSLLVGGIGIMNIMLVSVTERTREIGVRLAIGALGSEVLLQFLIESIVLSTLGGLIGIATGLGGAYAVTNALEFPFEVQPGIVTLAFFFSAFIGVVFGYLPARKAARLNPIDALRHE